MIEGMTYQGCGEEEALLSTHLANCVCWRRGSNFISLSSKMYPHPPTGKNDSYLMSHFRWKKFPVFMAGAYLMIYL